MRLFGGFALLGLAAFMGIGFLAGGGGDAGAAARIAAILISVGIPGTWGAVLLRRHFRDSPTVTAGRAELRRLTQSSEILKLAERKGGRLTVVEVVAETALPAEAAEEMLGAFVRQGLAEPEVTDKGLIVYVFGDVQQLGDKVQSRGLLDA
jgi:hypothetical protein